MQDKQLFEYAIIRLVPKVEREEFLNVGVILFCKKLDIVKVRFELNENKIKEFSSELDLEMVKNHLTMLQSIAAGNQSGPISKLSAPERFRWLTATRSTIIQTSKTHPGFSSELETTLNKLFLQMVS